MWKEAFSPAFTVASLGCEVISNTTLGVMVTVQEAETVLEPLGAEAVITAVPALTAVTFPLVLTVAVLSSELFQLTVTAPASFGNVVAVSCRVSPLSMDALV